MSSAPLGVIDDLLLPAARRRTVAVFVTLTVALLVVLPGLFLAVDWPGWRLASVLSVGQVAIIALHLWFFRRSLRGPTPPPPAYVVVSALIGGTVLSLGLTSGQLGSVWALGAALLLGDCVNARPWRTVVAGVAVAAVVAFVLGALLAPRPGSGGPNWVVATITGLYLAVLWSASVNRRYWLGSLTALDRSRRNAAALAAARERLRLADDLHDVLGHALEVVAFKSELASKLLPSTAESARTEIDEVARVAREAMSDVRTLARERRVVTLTSELAGARAVLASAGIALSVTGDPTLVPASAQEVLGRVLREAMTNLLRHSRATRCAVSVTHDSARTRLLVVNDGALGAPEPSTGAGTGLQGLRRYLDERDGRLSTSETGDGEFSILAEVPAAMAAHR